MMVLHESCDILIIGLGISGVTLATELNKKGYKIIAADMDSSPGGIYRLIPMKYSKYIDLAITNRLINSLKNNDIPLLLETTLIKTRYNENILISPKGVYKINSKLLIMASGSRSSTPTKLGLIGNFPAGILGIRSAIRLLILKKLVPGKRPVIYGSGLLTEIYSIILREYDIKPTLILPEDESTYINRNTLDSYDIDVITGVLKGVYGERRVEYISTADGQKIVGDALIIGIMEPDTLPLKFKYIDRSTGGPALNYNYSTIERGNIYVAGSAAAVFEYPDIHIEMANELARLIEREVEEQYMLNYNSNIRYVVPKYLSQYNKKVFLKAKGKYNKILFVDREYMLRPGGEIIIDIGRIGVESPADIEIKVIG
jgi:NADPH-dependent 2,4-dienoyl-CoA reductase/sulfur reductase-like enzyme